jgi:UDP-N-acetylglucosamine--dolichyl-phosphate N-acetylglucosaminephosphotransferase
MGALAVFATNAINIYAGINGLEAGQSLVVGAAVVALNVLELAFYKGAHLEGHLFSASLAMPFVGVTWGLLAHNVHPARVFVGDTYCYFAGMALACMAILGHFGKTLPLLLLPQIFNFLYSLPQLLKVYPCPRHRLPDYDARTDTMRPSGFELDVGGAAAAAVAPAAPAAAAAGASSALPGAGAARRRSGSVSRAAAAAAEPAAVAAPKRRRMDNFTLINLVLRVCGPMHERTLTNALLALQVVSCGLGLGLRYYLQSLFGEGGSEAVAAAAGAR